MILDWYLKQFGYWKLRKTTFCEFSLIYLMIFNILKFIFKSNSLSIKNHFKIKCSVLYKTLHFFCKLYPMTIISSDHKNKYNLSEIIYRVHGYWKLFAEIKNIKCICWNSNYIHNIGDKQILNNFDESQSFSHKFW